MQKLFCKNNKSGAVDVDIGIAQESVLGVILYADDINVIIRAKDKRW